jgi:pyruvate formate lyase activating enzyme
LYTLVYGHLTSQNVDPIEKKPLYHYYPGSLAYSIATPGCNFRCHWCQNWQISQMPSERVLNKNPNITPKQVVNSAVKTSSQSIAYTYTEPTIFFEFAYETARMAHQVGITNIFVTNGYITPETLDMFHQYLDAANVDLKSFCKETYRRYIGGRLQPVLDALKAIKQLGIWLEVPTLVIPNLNDDSSELRDIASFISQELGADTPWHISRFYPGFKMTDRPPTPIQTPKRARDIGLSEGLNYVYLGNILDESNTNCPQCGQLLIRRHGYQVLENHFHDGSCSTCGESIPGVWM